MNKQGSFEHVPSEMVSV